MKDELKRLITVSNYTFIEIYKSRIFLNTLFLGIALVLVCFVASEFTFGVPERVALDFGLGLISLSGVGIAIFMGVSLLAKEVESRTVYMILSRPVSRWSFLIGRILGFSLILLVNIVILGILTLLFYKYLGGVLSALIGWIVIFAFFEALIMLAIVVLFSLVTNSVRAVIFSIAIYIGGHTISDPTIIPFAKDNGILLSILKIYPYIFPDFTRINFKMYAIYQQSIESNTLIFSLLYSILYLFAVGILASYVISKKDLN